MTSATSRDGALPRAVAWAAVAVSLLLGWNVLTRLPQGGPGGPVDRLRLAFIERPPVLPQAAAPAPAVAGPRAAAVRRTAVAAPAPPARGQVAAAPASIGLYDQDGRIRLADAAGAHPGDGDGGGDDQARLLQRPDPIRYRETVFDRPPEPGQTTMQKLIFGRDIQAAKPRPPPDVRFNPATQARTGQAGAEAAGEGWRSAPIASEKAPGLKGEASRRIRRQLGELEQRQGHCGTEQLQAALAPALSYLEQLQRLEYAFARGADPVQAEQLMPRQADAAYDQARRALWWAERRLADCR